MILFFSWKSSWS